MAINEPWVCPTCGAAWSPNFIGPCLHTNMEQRNSFTYNIETKVPFACGICGDYGNHNGLPCPGGTVTHK